MNFQQLRIIRETVRRNFNLTDVAEALFTSQSGVSKHIKDLELELGVELFIRKGKRLLGLTEPGKEVAALVERMLVDARGIADVAAHYRGRDEGHLTVATTHTQARYALGSVVAQFKREFPRVHLTLTQGSPEEIAALLLAGEADIGVATEALAEAPELQAFPYYSWSHMVVVPTGHPLTAASPLTLEAVAAYPIITYHGGFTGRPQIDAAFARAGLDWDLVMAAMDADVIKTYVELGVGIGIIASMAFDPVRDAGLRLIPGSDLFGRSTSRIAIHRGRYLRGYALRFLRLCCPDADLPEER